MSSLATGATGHEPAFPKLFSPFRAGRLDLQSRLAMLPHGNAMVHDGVPTDEDIAYFSARARGVGLIVTGGTIAHAESRLRVRNLVEAFDPETIPMLRKRTDAVHALGARIVGQLVHLGRETIGAESEFAPAGASARRGPRDPYPPHVLADAELRHIIAGFASSARNLREAGYDGMEVHAAHGYLFSQFLSAATNTRSDFWGGSPDKRNRLLLETVQAVREACGSDFIIGVRLSADEETADGMRVPDTVGIARALAAQSEADYLNITFGVRGNYVKDATAPIAPAAQAAGVIRAESRLPVIVGQKIQTPELAEQILADGLADMVGVARAFVADARFAEKALTGKAARIRPCVGLNQDCRAFAPHLHCAVNPETGRETRAPYDRIDRAAKPKRIAVIGGGPAGMEAARVAAERGHTVTLFEASKALGGQFLLAASLPRRGGLNRLIEHLAGELSHADVAVRLGTRIDSLDTLARDFDEAVIATGALPAPLPNQPQGVRTLAWSDVLRDGAPAPTGGRHAVFADEGTGSWFSYGVAEKLIEAGWRVTFLTTTAAIGGNLPAESLGPMLARLGAAGTSYRVLTGVHAVGDGSIEIADLPSGARDRIACDLVVLQTGRVVTDALPGEDRLPVHRIGDCVTPRRISHALFEAQRIARAI